MKIKTCEEYVLQKLNNAEEKVSVLQSELESFYQGWNRLQKDREELFDKYDKLRQALYDSLMEITDEEIPYLCFKHRTHLLFNDDPNYLVIKEAVDSYARYVGVKVKGEPR